MQELICKPCFRPGCQGQPKPTDNGDIGYDTYVECKTCGMRTRSYVKYDVREELKNNLITILEVGKKLEELAINDWNNRGEECKD